MLRFTPKERRQAFAYRDMVRRVRRRSARERPKRPSRPMRGRIIDKEHKQAVAQLFCIATYIRSGVELYGVHVAHIRFSNAAAGAANPGLQRKPDDRWVLPLCPAEHRRQHAMGEADYWAELGVDPHAVAAELKACSPRLGGHARGAPIAWLDRQPLTVTLLTSGRPCLPGIGTPGRPSQPC